MPGAPPVPTDGGAPGRIYWPYGRCVVEFSTGRIVATVTGLGLDAQQMCDALNGQERKS